MRNQDKKDPLIVILSNRGPYKFKEKKDGTFQFTRGAGGLVTALGALVSQYDVLWVAAAMSKADRKWSIQQQGKPAHVEDIDLQLIRPDKKQYAQYYNVISNPLLWFIQHQLWNIPHTPSITSKTWAAWKEGYVIVNKLFADTVVEAVKDSDRPIIIMPQDYHLYLVPFFLRQKLGDRVQIQPFLHIPWPGIEAWRILPGQMRTQILSSMLQSDRIGFQTSKDAFNFVQACRFYLPDAHSHGSRDTISYRGRNIKAVAYPISIDVEKSTELVQEDETNLLKGQLLNLIGDRKLILRVDRIEPSKNILRGLEAYATLLDHYPAYRKKVQMLALLVPSRMAVNEYRDYLREIMALAGMINAQYSEPLWEPVRIIVGDNYRRALAAMQLYDVLLVNPLADGMNLVAKEGALVNQRNGSIVLSEYAGAYYELGEHAITVSPFDVYGTAEAIHEALQMSAAAREEQALGLRQLVEQNDVRQWFSAQVVDAMRVLNSQAKKSSTSGMPLAKQSAVSKTAVGVSADKTPTPTA